MATGEVDVRDQTIAVDLHGKDTVYPLLKQVDDYVHGRLIGPEDFGADHRMVRDFLLFDTFREQCRAFCLTNGIRTELVDSDPRWAQFVTYYVSAMKTVRWLFRHSRTGCAMCAK